MFSLQSIINKFQMYDEIETVKETFYWSLCGL